MHSCCTFKYSHAGGPGKEFTICGVDKSDHIFSKIMKTGSFYEADLLEYISSIVGNAARHDVCIDIGANIGNHSLFLGEFVASRLICVEANPKVLPVLQKNLESNIGNYVIYGCALGASEGKGIVVMPESSTDNIGMAQVKFIEEGEQVDDAVPVRTLDQIIEEFRVNNPGDLHIGLIKIDVEGSEAAVLSGASRTLSEHHPDLFIEAADKLFRQKIESVIKPYGYRRISRWAATPVYHYVYRPRVSDYLKAVYLKEKYKFRRRVARLKQKLGRAHG